MTFWWVPWFLKALGVSAIVLFIGWLKSLKRRKSEPEVDAYYEQVCKDCLEYAEHLYQQK